MDIDKAIQQFNNYTKDYINLNRLCELKVNHTMRVMNLCSTIAQSLGFDEEKVTLAKLCGLLHDIARFEQWRRFENFSDLESVDHGDLGVEILTSDNNNLLRKFIPDSKYDSIILSSVKYHNKYLVADELSEDEKIFTNIVRDADKIDILYLYTIGHIALDVKDDAMSDAVFTNLINKNEISRKDIITSADRLAVSLGFIFDINYKNSLIILKETDYYNKEIDIYISKTNNELLKKQLEDIRKIINNYLEEMILC